MELFSLLGTIAIDNTEANKAIKETTDEAKTSESEVSDAFTKIGGVASKIATGIGVAGMAIGGAFIATIESTREYRKEMGLLESAFLTAGHSSQNAKDTYSELNAILGDSGQAVEASQHLAKLADNEKELSTWTDIATGVFATFGESLPIESLMESSNEVSKTGILTGGLVDALNWAGISEEKFQEKLDKCTTEQERQKLIMDTLNGTYKSASDQYKETNKDIIESEKAQQRLTDAMAEVGAVGEPIMTAIKNAIADMAEKAVPVIESIIEKFRDMKQWIEDNGDTIDIWVAVILGATTAIGTFLLILNWGAIMATASKAINIVRTAIIGMNTAMMANPIGLIVALIAGLVVAFVYLWNNVEGFRKFWINAWNIIKDGAVKAWNSIKKALANIGSWFSDKFKQVQNAGKNAWTSIKNAWNSAGKWFSDTANKIKNAFSNIPSWFKGKFQSAWSNIKSVFSSWGSFFGGLWTKIKSKFSSIGSSLGSAMGNAVKSGMNAVISTIEKAINKGIGLINSAIKLANKLPAVNVGTLPKISLPRLEKGGILEKGQVGILEGNGAEAIVPLERTEWIDKVATRFEERMGHKPDNSSNSIMLERIISLLEQLTSRNLYLDSGVLVGELSPRIDARLGDRYKLMQRGNTR
jgi:phage-related protein